jgi:hypothetical protein
MIRNVVLVCGTVLAIAIISTAFGQAPSRRDNTDPVDLAARRERDEADRRQNSRLDALERAITELEKAKKQQAAEIQKFKERERRVQGLLDDIGGVLENLLDSAVNPDARGRGRVVAERIRQWGKELARDQSE